LEGPLDKDIEIENYAARLGIRIDKALAMKRSSMEDQRSEEIDG
jgi:hypothetical protein